MKWSFGLVLLAITVGMSGQSPPVDSARARLILETTKQVYKLGEQIRYGFRIQNDGDVSFYMNPSMEQVEGMDAGVLIDLRDEKGKRVSGQIISENASPNYAAMPDVVKHIQESWLLLRPHMFYDTDSYYPTLIRLEPGKYCIKATYFSNLLHAIGVSQKASLVEHLPHPLLTDEIRSNEVWIQIIAPGAD
jgi:hypothetical protein